MSQSQKAYDAGTLLRMVNRTNCYLVAMELETERFQMFTLIVFTVFNNCCQNLNSETKKIKLPIEGKIYTLNIS